MTTPTVEAAHHPTSGRSRDARRFYDDLMSTPPEIRRGFMKGMSDRERAEVLTVAAKEGGTPYVLWQDDPQGFVEDVLGESSWSKQNEVLSAIPQHKRVAVPAGFDLGKTHLAARATAWRVCVFPPGTSQTITIAPRFRQVQRQVWPHIRDLHKRCGLPGRVDMTQWRIPTTRGADYDAAYGFSAPPHQESAVAGIHAPNLFIVIEEAGGIGQTIGKATRGLLAGEGTRMLVIGNPPTDDEGSWFENLCTDDKVHTITISAYDSPNMTGEYVGRCYTCPPEAPEHSLASHLVEQEWIEDTISEQGEDAPYVISKVYAKFPKGGPRRAIPSTWIDAAIDSEEPVDDGETLLVVDDLMTDEQVGEQLGINLAEAREVDQYIAVRDLGLPEENDEWLVRRGAWVRLGVDVAADGGDEFAISRSVGDLVTLRHTAAGAANANSLTVTGEILIEILRAEALAAALGSKSQVHVKIDVIGLGWAVHGTLVAWGVEGRHNSKIIPVDVRENTYREPDAATMRPWRKRDELWLAGRALLMPTGPNEPGQLRLRVDKRTVAQLGAPTQGTNSSGMTVIESKASMKLRGVPSPDRAESVLMTVYEPVIKPKRKKAKVIV